MAPTKNCERCGQEFSKNPKYSSAQWAAARFCGHRCGAWNLGLTKNDDPRIAAYADGVRISAKGRSAWNKGLTKETDPRMAMVSKKVSAIQIGKTPTAAQLSGLEHGRAYFRGRTKENDVSVARRAEKLSEMYAGRSNPEHGERMRKFYTERPDLHPNAILARKTKGRGYTDIEQIVRGILDDLTIDAEFNHQVGRKWVDFGLPAYRCAIEADGARWHKDSKKERERDAYLAERGWRVLHLSDYMLKKQTKQCASMIADFVYSAMEAA